MPSDQLAVRLEVSRGPLAGPLVGRVVGMAASRAGFKLDALERTLDIADALVARAGAESDESHLAVEVATLPDGVQIVVGGLRRGGAERLVSSVVTEVVGDSSVGWSTQAGAGGDEFVVCTVDAPRLPAAINPDRNGSSSMFQRPAPRA